MQSRVRLAPGALVDRRVLGAARLVIGTAALSAPALGARVWLGGDASRGRRRFVRVVAMRDLVIGAGTLLDRRRSDGWLRVGIIADAADALVTVAWARPRLRAGSVAALLSAVAGVAVGTSLRSGARPGPTWADASATFTV